jgi:mannose/fructose/N-acetylgalactosamine-specific phosphotransferase system component IIC
MPHSTEQWVWFAFFAGGAVGGWMLLALGLAVMMRAMETKMKIGFFGLLTILFIGLKLTHYIDWSWWLVFSPLLVATAIFAAAVAVTAATSK